MFSCWSASAVRRISSSRSLCTAGMRYLWSPAARITSGRLVSWARRGRAPISETYPVRSMGRCSSRRPASSSRRHWTALDRGGACSIAGIHLSDVPSLDYGRHLYQERELRSVTANTREDARALLAEAAEAHVRPRTTAYALADANRALRDMKHSNIEGTPVLVIAAGES